PSSAHLALPSLSLFRPRRPPPHSTLFPYTTLFRSSSAPCSSSSSSTPGHSRGSRSSTFASSCQAAVGVSCASGDAARAASPDARSEEHTSELQSRFDLVCRLLLEKKKKRAARRATR